MDDVARGIGFVVLGGVASLWVGSGCSACAGTVGFDLSALGCAAAAAIALVILPLAALAWKG